MRELWTTGHKVELPEMLDGRESRARLQKQILEFCPDCSLICFTMNIAGPIKTNALIGRAFFIGCAAIEDVLSRAGISAERQIRELPYGNEAYYVVSEKEQSAEDLKRLTILVEEEHDLGRLFDIDIIKKDGNKVSRSDVGLSERRCLICGKKAAQCASTRAHTVSELKRVTEEMIFDHLRFEMGPETVCDMAFVSMMNEVAVTPKPGLVDLSNNGAHTDMTPALFEKSAGAIKDYFGECFSQGRELAAGRVPSGSVLGAIRPRGVLAEESMLKATQGVNTHKGAIFSLGIICAAWGYAGGFDIERILKTAGEIAAPIAHEEGLRGIAGGARTQAASGFAAIRDVSLPAFELAIKRGLGVNAAGVFALLGLIGGITDTNMIHRGGKTLAAKAGELVGKFFRSMKEKLENPDLADKNALEDELLLKASEFDGFFIENNLSPGGSADLLMLTLFCRMIKDIGE